MSKLGPTEQPNRIAYDYSIRHLLLVIGVSGSGKSTFINALMHRRLSSEITSALPHDVGSWILLGRPPRELRNLLSRGAAATRGQIMHYEITMAFKPKRVDGVPEPAPRLYSVSEDDVLKRRLAAAEEISVIVVGAPSGQLIRQLATRSILVHVPPFLRPVARLLAAPLLRLDGALPRWFTVTAGRILGGRWQQRSRIRERNEQLIALYAEQGALETIYRHWMASLMAECGGRIKRPVLCIEPMLDGAAHGTFRLAHREQITGRATDKCRPWKAMANP
jgi:hypothetical protein